MQTNNLRTFQLVWANSASLLILVLCFAGTATAQTQSRAEHQKAPPRGMMRIAMALGPSEAAKEVKQQLLYVKVEIDGVGDNQAHVINGTERIPVNTSWNEVTGQFTIEMPHYSSRIELEPVEGSSKHFSGVWSKRRGKGEDAKTNCRAAVIDLVDEFDNPEQFAGRWEVAFKDEPDSAVGVFQKAKGSNEVYGTFLTTTGDYRYLAGGVKGDELTLSCFDGGHAFLFKAKVQKDGSLNGVFHSGSWYNTTWTAKRNETISLPDAFKQTTWTGKVALSELKYPGLDGIEIALDDKQLAGKCRIIEIFGSWCPNCHDAGVYLSELHTKYQDRGLSITGLAFELTGDLEKDTAQVKTFIERNKTAYPILVAGTADKSEATEQLKLLDRVRSYPTMIFLDQGGNVRAIYTGFSGPATGEAHAKLREQFEKLIETILDE